MQDQRCVKLLLHNGDGEFLVLKRSDEYPEIAGTFDLPGGKAHDGETDIVALDR